MKSSPAAPFEILRRRWYVWAVAPLAIGEWLLIQRAGLDHPAWVLAALACLAVTGWLFELGRTLVLAGTRRIGRPTAAARLIALSGLVLAGGAGIANWALSLQGYVILKELETVPVHHGAHLLALEMGPLASIDLLDLEFQLEELELATSPTTGPYPRSRLRIRSDGEVVIREVDPWNNATLGSLRLYQGAFGFAPRIVLQRRSEIVTPPSVVESGEDGVEARTSPEWRGETLFDEVVPFTTQGSGERGGILFEETIPIGVDDLTIYGAIDLTGFDEAMRGHATLVVAVRQGARLLGRGTLRPGHFAEISDGYRVGFTGLEQWSEIDISHRNYASFLRLGLILTGIGLVAMLFAGMRRR